MRSTGVPSPTDTTPATMLARSRSDRVWGGPASGSLLWCWLRNLCVLLKTPNTTELYTAMLARGKDMPLKKPNTCGERKRENCSRVPSSPHCPGHRPALPQPVGWGGDRKPGASEEDTGGC